MKHSKSVILKRQNYILQRLSVENSILIEDIANDLQVSALTIRRDFHELEQKGLLERFHGGAKYISRTLLSDPAIITDSDKHENIKRIIAKKASSFVKEGETIFINSSSTAQYMFEYLSDLKITIITNNANSIKYIDNAKYDLFFTGGLINSFKHSMFGRFAVNMLNQNRVNKCFIGVSAINKNGAINTAVLQETTINIVMMQQTNEQVFILASSEKIGVQHNFDIGSLESNTVVITDDRVTDEQKKIIQLNGSQFVTA